MRYDSAPVGYTCPDIDRIIRSLNDAKEYIESAANGVEDLYFKGDDSTESMKKAVVSDLDNAIGCVDLSGELETLRSANDSLRTWGYDLVEKLKESEKENEDLIEQINELQNLVEDLNKEIQNAERCL